MFKGRGKVSMGAFAAAVALGAEDQALSVRHPDRIEVVGGMIGHPRDVGAVGIHHEQIEAAVARRHERDTPPVRRPLGVLIVMIAAGGELADLARREIEREQMVTAVRIIGGANVGLKYQCAG